MRHLDTATDPSSATYREVERPRASRWLALPVLLAGTFVIVLDFFIVNVALPSIQFGLHADTSSIEWVVAGYGLTFAIFLITAGRVGDRVGRRRVFSLGLALFTLASLGCGMAPSASILVASRLLQGVGGALISPSVLSIIGIAYTGADRVRAISVYGLVMGLGAAGGQLLGGLLMQLDIAGLGWRSVFLINIPVGAAALVLAPRLVPESRARVGTHLDVGGLALLTLALTALILPLVEGRQQGWPAWSQLSLGVAPLLFGTLAVQQNWLARRGGAPLIDLGLFRERTFSAGLLTQFALWCGQASFFLLLALYLQRGRGLAPLQSGLVFSILAAAFLMASLQAPALTIRHGRSVIATGALTLAAGHVLLLLALAVEGSGGSIALLAPGLLLVGAGMGLSITPLTTTVLASVDAQRAGAVAGALSTMQQVGNSLGVAASGVIFFSTLSAGYARAFQLTLFEFVCLLVAVAALTRLLPVNRRLP